MKNIPLTNLFPASMRKFLAIVFVALVLCIGGAEDSFGYSDYGNYTVPVSQNYYDSYDYGPSYPYYPPAPQKRTNFWSKFAPILAIALAVTIRNNWDQLKRTFK